MARFSLERLRSFFNPRSIALIGASDKSSWSLTVYNALTEHGFDGRVHYVNPRSPNVHGQPASPSISAIGEPIDLGFVMLPRDGVIPTIRELAACGVPNAIVISAGFAEQDDIGRVAQAELVDIARSSDMAVLGPNCLGFVNVQSRVEAFPSTFDHPLLAGPIGLVAQSGGLAATIMNYARMHNVGLNYLITTGNEAVLTVADVMRFLIEDPAIKVVALVIESIRDVAAFTAGAQRALEIGKPIVALKMACTPLGKRLAFAHTASDAGDDVEMDDYLSSNAVVRVASLEELVLTAGVMAKTGVVRGKRLGFVSISGGACEIVADAAVKAGIDLPALADSTRDQLQELLPVSCGYNPLDTTGTAVTSRDLMALMLSVVGSDPSLDLLLCNQTIPNPGTPGADSLMDMLASIVPALREMPCSTFLVDRMHLPIADETRTFIAENNIPFLSGGLQQVIPAIGRAIWWSEKYRARSSGPIE
ncbi:MAG: hypothetical protein EPO21_00405 [Chloroflexota bacterium]|nr:MAG: hypothetical protein EPO21_00405 [Chloroflexota bacterium]